MGQRQVSELTCLRGPAPWNQGHRQEPGDGCTVTICQQIRGRRMTYCVGILLDEGMVFASDSRTNAGVDNIATFCKMTVLERPGDRVIVLLSSGNLAGTQAVISLLKQRGEVQGEAPSVWNVDTEEIGRAHV